MLQLDELKSKADTLRKQLATVDALTGKTSERDRDAKRKRTQRAEQKLVVIPRCEDRVRREQLEAHDINWLRWYFGPESGVRDPFTYLFTEQQAWIIEAFHHVLIYGGDQALAAARGDGKTTLLERLIAKYTLQGVLPYSVLFAATGSLADNSLDTIKTAFEENDHLCADYPEVCVPVRALENTPNRAHYQLVNGFRHDNGEPYEMASSRFTWCGQEIIFPKVPGSPSAEAIIATRGLDAAVRGLKKKGRRPRLAAIDDADTEETARSEEQSIKLEDRIDRAIAGLGDQQHPVSRLFVGTIPSRLSCAYKFTDPQQKPTWKGRRFRYLIQPPERMDLWEEYIQIRQTEFREFAADESDDKHCRQSHQFYLDRREIMDADSIVGNPNRFNGDVLPDGSQEEVSSLQHYFNEVAKLGQEAVDTEYNNDPPEELGPIESGLTATKIQQRLSGYERRLIPPDCKILTQGIDVQKAGLHWVVKAWRDDATNYVIDYGFYETHGTTYGSDEGIEFAIRRAILGRMEQMTADPCAKSDGEIVDVALTLIDSGWQAPTVYQACAEIGLGIYPGKGHGKSHGCATPNFSDVLKRTLDRKPGDGWFMTRQASGIWLVHCDTDRWKSFEHDRWLTPEGKPGAAYLFGEMTDDERRNMNKRVPREVKEHFAFSKHLTSEMEVEDIVRGVLKRVWRTKAGRVQNHYFDASYLADIAAAMKGIRLLGEGKPITKPSDRPTAAAIAELARRR